MDDRRSRRDFVRGLSGLGALLVLPSCRPSRGRAEVLRALVRDVVAPSTARVVTESRALGAALDVLERGGSAAALEAARSAFGAALLAWKRASTFRSGPIVESKALLRAAFWPSRPRAVDRVLADARPIDERRIEEVGADAKGIFGIEYALFGADGERAERGAALDDRRRRYAAVACRNVVAYAERTASMLGDGFDRSFSTDERSVEQLVIQSTDTLEVVVGRITRILRLRAQGALRPTDVEGYFSETSRDIALSLLDGTEALYAGTGTGGLAELTVRAAPDVDARMRTHFGAARDALLSVAAPLEQAALVKPAALENAQAALRALEVCMKAEVTSALGVNITFTAFDGD